jgi:hypothetical protein
MRRTGRAVVVWSLVWYVLAQLAVLLMTERWRPVLVATEDIKWPRLRQLVAERPDHSLILMLGSSRVGWAMRAAQLDGMLGPDGRPLLVYNFGMPTTGPIHQRLYLRQLLAEGIRPRLLVVEFTPPLLCAPHRGVTSEESMTRGDWASAARLRELTPYFRHPGRKTRDWLEARLAPWYAFRVNVHDELKCLYDGKSWPKRGPTDEQGWRILPRKPPSLEESPIINERVAVEHYGPGLRRFRVGAGSRRALDELLETCRRERIETALVVMPESSRFRSLYSAEATATARALLNELHARHGVEVIDARGWLADEDFQDGHHVLRPGATHFTARLGSEIQRLLARRACSASGGLGQ